MKKPFLILITALLLFTLVSCSSDDAQMPEFTLSQSTSSSSNSPSDGDVLTPVDQENLLGAWILTESSFGNISVPVEEHLKIVMKFDADNTLSEYHINDGSSFELVTNVKQIYSFEEGNLLIHSFFNVTVEEYKEAHPELDPSLTDEEIMSKYIDLGTVTYKAQMRGDTLVLSLDIDGTGDISYIYSPYTEELPKTLTEE